MTQIMFDTFSRLFDLWCASGSTTGFTMDLALYLMAHTVFDTFSVPAMDLAIQTSGRGDGMSAHSGTHDWHQDGLPHHADHVRDSQRAHQCSWVVNAHNSCSRRSSCPSSTWRSKPFLSALQDARQASSQILATMCRTQTQQIDDRTGRNIKHV